MFFELLGEQHLYQYDIGRKIKITTPEINEVHFANKTMAEALIMTVPESKIVEIPNQILTQPYKIYVYAYITTEDSAYTKEKYTIEVIPRQRVSGLVFQPTITKQDEVMAELKEMVTTMEKMKEEAMGDKHYEHIQNEASSVWTISHNLNKYPSCTVVDSAGSTVIGDVDYIDLNNLQITFTGAFTGKAYIN